VREGVADLTQPTPEEKSAIAENVHQRYATYPLQMLVEMNVDGVAKELAAELASTR
jgi:hypothetical protein